MTAPEEPPTFHLSYIAGEPVMALTDVVAVLYRLARSGERASVRADLYGEFLAGYLEVHVCDDARALDLS